jgi:hypothetical protein
MKKRLLRKKFKNFLMSFHVETKNMLPETGKNDPFYERGLGWIFISYFVKNQSCN